MNKTDRLRNRFRAVRRQTLVFTVALIQSFDCYKPTAESLQFSSLARSHCGRLIVVGKVIIDEYGKPNEGPGIVSVGGGGPQAALGAALALAVLSNDTSDPPKKQPITFVGPVGGDWAKPESDSLDYMLASAIESVVTIKGECLRTPRIQLWHDDFQQIQWMPIENSFGPNGADGLWNNRPSATDMIPLLGDNEMVSFHVILEAGMNGPGNGGDVRFLDNDVVKKKVAFLGIEPVAFPDQQSGKVSDEDASCMVSRLTYLSPGISLVSPDKPTFDAVHSSFWNRYDVAIRNGPMGSIVLVDGKPRMIPPATLTTPDGCPVNPTGAGNAYSGAMTALRSRGVSMEDAACIASAIGATFCEYSHVPPWSTSVLSRVRQAAVEVKEKLGMMF